MSISSIFNTAKESMMVHQMAIDVTSANISNVNTPGYSRQTINMVSTALANVGLTVKDWQNGVNAASVVRSYSAYLEAQIVEQKGLTGYSQAQTDILAVIEAVFDESKAGGLADLMNRFWNRWQDLSLNPEGVAERAALVSAAETVAKTINDINFSLQAISGNIERDVASVVDEINFLLTDIADLNNKIVRTNEDTGDRNILENTRMELVKKLGSLVDVRVIEGDYGSIKVYLSNGEALVDGVVTWPLATAPQAGNPTVSDIVFAARPTVPVTQVITSGRLGALLEMRDTVIPGYMAQMDAFAASLASEVNIVHQAGYDSYQTLGLDFFLGNSAATLRVNPAIVADIKLVAASENTHGQDGANALKMSLLQDMRVSFTVNSLTFNNTFSNYYSGVVGQVGHKMSDTQNNLLHQSLVMDRLVNQRESVSGVSIDEEMIKLIQYQLGYNAAAKLCATAQEMMDTLLQLKQ